MLRTLLSRRAYTLTSTAACALAVASFAAAAPAFAGSIQPMITAPVDDAKTVAVEGNIRPEVKTGSDLGAMPDSTVIPHLTLQLQRSPAQEAAARTYIDELHNKHSPNFHRWLSPTEVNDRFGLAASDLAAVTTWLSGHGFKINGMTPNLALDVTATAGQIRSAFGADIHYLSVGGVRHFANVTNPHVPAALAAALRGPTSLSDFQPHPMLKKKASHKYTTSGGYLALVPADLQTIYNFGPLYSAGLTGAGQTIVVVESSGLYTTGDWFAFRKILGLTKKFPQGTLTTESPGTGCTNPGDAGSTDAEVAIDVEWASAAAPNANIVMAACKSGTQFGGFIALQNILATPGHPNIVSISYGESESQLGATENAYISTLYQTAVLEGVSVFVSSGDEGSASTDANKTTASHGITVSGFTSTPYNISVGGTDYEDSYLGEDNLYWSATNNPQTFGSALSYIPEIPWNDSCASQLLYTVYGYSSAVSFCASSTAASDGYHTTASGSGGPSNCATGAATIAGVASGTCAGYAKPSWQTGLVGNPADGVRDIPDVSGFAANGVWGHYYVVCYSHAKYDGTPCGDNPSTWAGYGGTSVSSPIMAATQALINERTGESWGNANTVYYAIANSQYGASGNPACNSSASGGPSAACDFHDVTVGDMDVNCVPDVTGSSRTSYTIVGTFNCYGGTATLSNSNKTVTYVYGAQSVTNGTLQPAYGTSTGWDFATGIGTVNATSLVEDPAWLPVSELTR
jgi:subtilase family serine protease